MTSDERRERLPLFIEALDGEARLARRADKPVAVVIDEFQKVIEWGGEHAEGQIRAALQRHGDVGFVFAGSKSALLNDMTLNPARPFYRMGVRHFLGPVERSREKSRACRQYGEQDSAATGGAAAPAS